MPVAPCYSDQVGGTVIDCSSPNAFVDANGDLVGTFAAAAAYQAALAGNPVASSSASPVNTGGSSFSSFLATLGGFIAPIASAVNGPVPQPTTRITTPLGSLSSTSMLPLLIAAIAIAFFAFRKK